MSARRIPPLAIAFALVAAALIAATWATRSTVNDAFIAAREGEAIGVEQAVRADLVELGGPATAEQLEGVLRDHAAEGLRYVGVYEAHGQVAAAGTPLGGPPSKTRGRPVELEHVGSRVRLTLRGRRVAQTPRSYVMEIEPIEADELRASATYTMAIGGIAALILFGVAIALVRRELRRGAEERTRERERRLASLGEMSAVLAHEIRNPLASLKGNAQLLAAGLDEKSRAKAERVVEEAKRLERLTTDLLAFVRTGDLKREPVAPGPLVREAAGTVGEVEIDAAAAPQSWPLDPARMRQVLVNLLDNAIAAGPPVRASVRAERGRLVIEISDSGKGVPKEDRERIFEPFFTGKTRGTGLGLAIARRVIELHRGTIAVDEAPGGGARFRVEIPES